MSKVIQVIRARWPEVLMIVVLQTGLYLLIQRIGPRLGATVTPGRELALFIATVAMLVIVQMVSVGFMATVPRYSGTRCEPVLLLRIGRYFFWRLIRFELLMFVFLLAVLSLMLHLFGALLGVSDPNKFPIWAVSLSNVLTLTVLSKPLVLIPAVMIVCDRMVVEALHYLRRYPLGRVKPVLALFVGLLLLLFGLTLLADLAPSEGLVHQATLLAYAAVVSVGAFLVGLRAVLFVAERETPPPPPPHADADETSPGGE